MLHRRRSSAIVVFLLALILPSVITAQQPSNTPTPDAGPPSTWRAAPNAAPQNCIAETSPTRALNAASTSAADMTIAKCIAFCDARNFVLAGLQYARECQCGPFLTAGASLDQITRCTMQCAGDASGDTICGGSNAISLFVSNSPRAQRLKPDFKSATLVIPPGWSDVGCVMDRSGSRVLGAQTFESSSMTIDQCTSFCAGFGMPYSGLSGTSACFCDSEMRHDYGPGDCNLICSSDNMVYCGGQSGVQASATISTHIYHNPALSPFDECANGYSYRGCIQDPPNWALTAATFTSDLMTIEICTAFCANQSYKYAGVGFARECRCDNVFQNGAGLDKPSTACIMACPGDKSTICGGSYAVSLYELDYTQSVPEKRRALPLRNRRVVGAGKELKIDAVAVARRRPAGRVLPRSRPMGNGWTWGFDA